MAYFSNGTEGMMYEEQWCSRCIHNEGCAVWMAHQLHNYDECNKKESILHELIPMDEKLHPQKCTMFIEAAKTYKGTIPEHLHEWAKKNEITAVS